MRAPGALFLVISFGFVGSMACFSGSAVNNLCSDSSVYRGDGLLKAVAPIINGKPSHSLVGLNVSPSYARAIVSLMKYEKRTGSFTYFCSGAFISDEYILTAAHCINGNGSSEVIIPANMRVYVGRDYRDPDVILEATEIIAHPAFLPKANNEGEQNDEDAYLPTSQSQSLDGSSRADGSSSSSNSSRVPENKNESSSVGSNGSKEFYKNDLAVIRVDRREVPLTIRPVPINTNTRAAELANQGAHIVGYGSRNSRGISGDGSTRQWGRAEILGANSVGELDPYVEESSSRIQFGVKIDPDYQLVIGSSTSDPNSARPCLGDSGSPLLLADPDILGKIWIIGVTSIVVQPLKTANEENKAASDALRPLCGSLARYVYVIPGAHLSFLSPFLPAQESNTADLSKKAGC